MNQSVFRGLVVNKDEGVTIRKVVSPSTEGDRNSKKLRFADNLFLALGKPSRDCFVVYDGSEKLEQVVL